MKFNYNECENLIGYVFNDKNLLLNAFTHSSYANEHKEYKSNERLEFLGDSILGFVITEYLYENLDKTDEGKMTVIKQNLVSKKPLSSAIIKKGLQNFLISGEGERKDANLTNISENLFEAIVAAIYLDGGISKAKEFIFSLLDLSDIPKGYLADDSIDYKSRLLHLTQFYKLGEIEYYEISKTGPDHKPIFLMGVKVGNRFLSSGKGSSHKEGEKLASKKALEILQKEGFSL